MQAVSVAGDITLNGGQVTRTCNSASPATVTFRETGSNYTLRLDATCDDSFSFAGTVFPGIYQVSVDGNSYSNLPQGSAFVVVERLVVP